MRTAPRSDRAAAFHGRALGAISERPDGSDAATGPGHRGADEAAGRRDPALTEVGTLAIVGLGLALGLAATALVLARGWDPGAVAVGPWVARPSVGTPAIDPYARADLARSGEVPMPTSEGLAFAAATDDTGYRLLRSCSYRLEGLMPPGRFWTLSATGADGRTMDNPAHRSAFTSATVVRDLAGRFAIDLSPEARPGNWLPLSGDGPLTLTLRLYDTPLAGDAAEVASATLPSIARMSCAAPVSAAAPVPAVGAGARSAP